MKLKNRVVLFFLLLLYAGGLNATGVFDKRQFVITDYGAVGDNQTLNTAAIQKAIDACAANGGGMVVIPKGTFKSGAVFLKNKVALLVLKDGTLMGSTHPEDYPQIQTRWEGTECLWTAALVNAIDLTGVSITGEGTIDGAGDVWVKEWEQNKLSEKPVVVKYGRPRLIGIQNCKTVTIAGLKLHNQAVWCVHILYSQDVVLKKLRITADHNIPSSDGIDIDSSKDVKVQHCFIDVNDDCISIKSGKDEDGLRVNKPSENILIEDCHFGYGHGGVAMGSETSGGIKNVLIQNCVVDAGNWAPIRFKSQPSRGGVVENITYKNIKLNQTRKAVEFNMAWRMVPPVKPAAKILPVVRNIKLINITGIVNSVGDISGLDGSPIQNVVFEKCVIKAKTGISLKHIANVNLDGLTINVEEGPAILKNNVN